MQNSAIQKVLMLFLVTILSTTLYADVIKPIILNSTSLQWFDAMNLPPGAKLIFLTGNPNKREFYVARLKMPANFTVPSHHHAANEYDTVISGTYYLGVGKKMKKDQAIVLSAGSFVEFPAGVQHDGFTKEETILEISGIGPWGTIPDKLA